MVRWVVILCLAFVSCDTCRSLDSVARPTEEGVPDGGPTADTSLPDADTPDADVGPSPDVRFPDTGDGVDADRDMTLVEGCPRQGSTTDWGRAVATLPKITDVPIPAIADGIEPDIDLTRAGPVDGDGMLAFAFRYAANSNLAGIVMMFEPDADIRVRDEYSSFDVILPDLDVTRVAIRGDDQDRDRFQFAATGTPRGCVDQARTGAFGSITPSGGGALPDFTTYLTDCSRVQPPAGIVGPYGPGAPAMVARDSVDQIATYLLKQAEPQLEAGPAWGGWTDGMAASRRELVLIPAATAGQWHAWFPLLDQTVGALELGAGAISMDWLYRDCHAVAVEDGTTIDVSALDCSTSDCEFAAQASVEASDGEVSHVDVAPMPGGGFVVAYATSSDVFASFFDDDFRPVTVDGSGDPLRLAGAAGVVGDIAVAAVGPSDSPQLFVAFSDIDAETVHRIAAASLVPR